jgi:hypothetical protein
MLMKRIGIDNSINKRKVKVYNVDTKECLGEFESSKEASDFAGVRPSSIANLIRSKTRNRVNKLGLTLAFR